MSSEPIRLLEGADTSDVERSLLRQGRSSPPAPYDVGAGAARFRRQLAVLAAAGVAGAGVASGSSALVRGKAILLKVAFKVVLGLMAGGVFAGAGVVAGMHMARTASHDEAAPLPPKAEARVVATLPPVRTPSSVEPEPTPPPVAPIASSADARPAAGPIGSMRRVREPARHPGNAPSQASGVSLGIAEAHDGVDVTSETGSAPSPVATNAPQVTPQPPPSAQPPAPAPPPEQPAAKPSDLLSEVRAVALARTLVERDPGAALELLEKTRREHPTGYFVEERQALTVLALSRAGQQGPAREQAEAFLKAYPNGPFSDRVRAVTRP